MDMYFFDPTFDLFTAMFFIIFFLILGTIIINIIRGVNQWSYNNKQPILDVKSKVVSKRSEVIRHTGHVDSNGVHHNGGSSTNYYITFEFESTDRMEFSVSGKEFGMIIEGDVGILKFQGSRYLEFKRDI
ncbi:DUF2500 domain-containing protein [Romboutsia sp. 1001713B170131_170501_G6]|uniref:DUF2500 domain-containing protein n=1 Tax=Romboutsia sp. 1001713B170131_170501_G6 TaxID=2787108 RepID=UPI001FABD97B|nr:DUF2500 domain-containing protein [Romboutsia sp. 1001713B170131_170501_G6]